MTTTVERSRPSRLDDLCTSEAKSSSGELHAGEARAMLSELAATPLRQGVGWDAEARARFAEFQRSEGLPPTGDLDDVSARRLQRRFEDVASARRADDSGHVVDRSPTQESQRRVTSAVREAVRAAENLASQFAADAPIRARYVAEARGWSESVVRSFEQGAITEGEAAYLASSFRNSALVEARAGLSPAGAALSRHLKEEGVSLSVLVERYALRLHGKAVKDLTLAERNAVCLRIAQKAGATNEVVNASARLAPLAGKALVAVGVAIAFYQVATAEDKVGEVVRQGAGFLGFWAGAKVGAIAGGAACGPGAPACAVIGGLAGGLLGALAAEAAADHAYQAIKG
jgi:hypothetical protein